jgi:hypothetical protein
MTTPSKAALRAEPEAGGELSRAGPSHSRHSDNLRRAALIVLGTVARRFP